MGYFEIQSIDNLYEIVVAINPEEYHEHFEDFRCNEKNKAKKKSSPGINFENFAKRILSVNEIENFENPKSKYQEQQRFSVVGGEIQKTYKQMIKGSICLMESHPYIKDTCL